MLYKYDLHFWTGKQNCREKKKKSVLGRFFFFLVKCIGGEGFINTQLNFYQSQELCDVYGHI